MCNKKKRTKKNKGLGERGVISYFMVWVLVIVIFLLFFGFMVPFSISFNSQLAESTDTLLNRAYTDANSIEDANVRSSLVDSISQTQGGLTESTDNLGAYLQYSWVLLPLIVTMIFFIATRQNVERGLA